MLRACRIALAAVLLAGTAAAQAPPPDPAAIALEASRYRFDLARNFFASPEAEAAARPALLNAAEEAAALAASADSPAALLAAIEAEDRLQRAFRRHDLYLFLRYAIDVRQEESVRAADALRAPVRAARAALRRNVAGRDQPWLDRAIAAEPRLARYTFWIETMRRDARHMLGPEQQAAVAALEPALGASDYPRIVNALRFETVEVDGRRLDARRNQSEIDAHPSAAVRREGARLLFSGYAARRDVMAYMIGRSVAAADALARLRGFADAGEEAAFERYLSPGHVDALFAAVARHAAPYQAWQQRVEAPFAVPMRWTPSAAVAAVVASAGPLGAEYRREFAELLDRRNGRADFAGGDHRLPLTGTASVYPTGASAIYMDNFEGVLLDLIVLAHEGGHAVQAQLMHRAGVPMAYAAGPGYFTESFGRFQELLLLDHLRRVAATPGDRRRYRDALASRLLAVFPSAEEAGIEWAIHRAWRSGEARTADDLDRITAATGSLYSIDYQRTPERRALWQLAEGYYMYPLQGLDGPYAALLAIRYFEMHRRNPADFRARYLRLLAGGYDAAPDDLLQRHLGFAMLTPEFAEETLAALDQEVARLYAE